MEEKRFEVVYRQGTMEVQKIIVDRKTGVEYLQMINGYAGGLTVLVDRDGKPLTADQDPEY
jgi:hypothetical protein